MLQDIHPSANLNSKFDFASSYEITTENINQQPINRLQNEADMYSFV